MLDILITLMVAWTLFFCAVAITNNRRNRMQPRQFSPQEQEEYNKQRQQIKANYEERRRKEDTALFGTTPSDQEPV